MRATWMARLGAVTLLLALTGCGASDSSEATQTPTPTTSALASTSSLPTSESSHPTGSPADGCPYLTAEQVTAALGAPTLETAGSLNACFFDPESSDGPSAMVSRVDVQIDPEEYAQQTRKLCTGDITEVEAGGDAFACVLGLGPTGQVYLGRVLITINVSDDADDATGIAAAAALLPLVTVPAQ